MSKNLSEGQSTANSSPEAPPKTRRDVLKLMREAVKLSLAGIALRSSLVRGNFVNDLLGNSFGESNPDLLLKLVSDDIEQMLREKKGLITLPDIEVNGQQIEVNGVNHVESTFWANEQIINKSISDADVVVVEYSEVAEQLAHPKVTYEELHDEFGFSFRAQEIIFFLMLAVVCAEKGKPMIVFNPQDGRVDYILLELLEAEFPLIYLNYKAFKGTIKGLTTAEEKLTEYAKFNDNLRSRVLTKIMQVKNSNVSKTEKVEPELEPPAEEKNNPINRKISRRQLLRFGAVVVPTVAAMLNNPENTLPLRQQPRAEGQPLLLENTFVGKADLAAHSLNDYRDIVVAEGIDQLTASMEGSQRVAIYQGAAHLGVSEYLQRPDVCKAKSIMYKADYGLLHYEQARYEYDSQKNVWIKKAAI